MVRFGSGPFLNCQIHGPDPQFRLQVTIFVYGTVPLQVWKIFLKKKIYISGKMHLLNIHELTKAQPGQNPKCASGQAWWGPELRISSQQGRPRGRLPRTLSRPLGEREGGGNGTRRANQGRGEELTNKTIVNNYQISAMTIGIEVPTNITVW